MDKINVNARLIEMHGPGIIDARRRLARIPTEVRDKIAVPDSKAPVPVRQRGAREIFGHACATAFRPVRDPQDLGRVEKPHGIVPQSLEISGRWSPNLAARGPDAMHVQVGCRALQERVADAMRRFGEPVLPRVLPDLFPSRSDSHASTVADVGLTRTSGGVGA